MSGVLLAAVGNSYGYKPINTVAPAVTGTAQARQTLTCSTGTWNAAPLPITYTYQWQKNGSNISGATNSTYVILSADVGSTLRCVVTATNAVGATSATSNTTATVVANVPTAPTIGTATATGSTTATVAFTASSDNGGATITSYTAVSTPGGLTATGASSPLTVTGLTPATSYTFRVYATNSVGNSAQSNASNSITTQDAYWFSQTNQGGNTVGLGAVGSSVVLANYNEDYAYSPYWKVIRMYGINGATGGTALYSNQFGGANGTSNAIRVFTPQAPYTYGSTTYVAAHNDTYATAPTQRGVIYGVNSSGSLTYSNGLYATDSTTYATSYCATTLNSSGTLFFGASSKSAATSSFTSAVVARPGSWAKLIYSGRNDEFKDLAANTSHVAYLSSANSTGNYGLLNISDGSRAWTSGNWYRSDGGSSIFAFNCAIDSSSNSYFCLGGSWGGDVSCGLFKYNSSGTLQWGLYTTGNPSDYQFYVTLASDGFLYMYGKWVGSGSFGSMAIVKISTAGAVQWTRRFYSTNQYVSAGGKGMAVIGSAMYIPVLFANAQCVLKMPTDGSRTGTYGNFVYDTSGPSLSSGAAPTVAGTTTLYNWPSTTFSPSVSSASFSYSTSVTNT